MRQQPITVTGAEPLERREAPEISAPSFQTSVRNRGLEIVQTLSEAAGVAAKYQAHVRKRDAEDQDRQYQKQIEEIERYETQFQQAKARGDEIGSELYYRKILDLSNRGAEDGSLTSEQRTHFQGRLQGYYSDEAAFAKALEEREAREASTNRKLMAESISTGVVSSLGSFANVQRFVNLGYRGSQLTDPLTEEVENQYLLKFMSYGMTPEEAGAQILLPEYQNEIQSTVETLTNKVSQAYDKRDNEAFENNRVENALNFSRDARIDPSVRMDRLRQDYKVSPESARRMVVSAEIGRMKRSIPASQHEFDILSGQTQDPILELTDTERNSIARNTATNVIQATMADLTPTDVVTGSAMTAAAIVLNQYGFGIDQSDPKNPRVVGHKNDFEEAFANEFSRFLIDIQKPESVVFTNSTQASQMFRSLNTLDLLHQLGDVTNPRSYTNMNEVFAQMERANPGMFDQPFQGKDGATLGEVVTDSVAHWLQSSFDNDEDRLKAKEQTALLMGEVMARFLEHSEIVPQGLSDAVRDALENGGSSGAAWALQFLYAGGEPVRRQVELQGLPDDTKYALDTILDDALTTGLTPDRLSGLNLGEQVTALREEKRHFDSIREALRLDPARSQKMQSAISKAFPGTIIDPEAYDVLGSYLVAVGDGYDEKTAIKKALKLTEAAGFTPYIDYNTGRVPTLNLSRGYYTRSPQEFAAIQDRFSHTYKYHQSYKRALSHGAIGVVDRKGVKMERYPDKFFAEEFGVKPLEAEAMWEILSGRDTHNQVRMTQTEEQTMHGGATLSFMYLTSDGSVRRTKTFALDEAQFTALITGTKE